MKHLAFTHNNLITNVDSASKLGNYLTKKIFSRLLLLIQEKMTKLSLECAEQIREESKSSVRRQLLQKDAFMNDFSVLIQYLIGNVEPHSVI
jgi:hypothetical protein